MFDSFVFIIGFNKTATVSIHNFFNNNNIPSIHWNNGRVAKDMMTNVCESRKIFYGYDENYRVYSDMSMLNERIVIEGNAFFRFMDEDYPESYFIYNKRNIDDWVESRMNHSADGIGFFERYKQAMRATDQEEVTSEWRRRRLQFEADVAEYFQDSDRLLILDVDDRDPARKIASFLRLDLDMSQWRRANKTLRKRAARS
jgi:hypothetical protein